MEKEAAVELNATIPALLARQVVAHGSETILRKKDRGIWRSVSWSELNRHVMDIGQGLRAIGLTAGSAAAVISGTRPELAYADLAILGCGAISVAIHPEEEAARVAEILQDANVTIAIVEDEEQLDKVLSQRSVCPSLQRIAIVDMKGLRDFSDASCVSLDDLIALGTGQSDWKAASEAITAGHIAAILYPRLGAGHPITHGAIMQQLEETARSLGVTAGDERLSVLPMCDPTERVLGLYLALANRVVSNYLENPETATENLREVKPTVLGANTEAWERLRFRIETMAAGATGLQKMAYRWAIGGGFLANWLVLPAIRGELGFGRLRVAYVGDAPVSVETGRWASALGITVKYINPFEGETHA